MHRQKVDDPTISVGGRYVVFTSEAPNLVTFDSDAGDLVDSDTNGLPDIYSHDRRTGETTRVSVTAQGVRGDGLSVRPVVSRDGGFVAFSSLSTNLVPGDTNDIGDAFRVDLSSAEQTRSTETALECLTSSPLEVLRSRDERTHALDVRRSPGAGSGPDAPHR